MRAAWCALVFLVFLPCTVATAHAEDAWQRAQALESGEERALALEAALAEVSPEELPACLQLAFEEFLAATRGFRTDLALPLAEAMHARAGATWSAMSLALVSTRVGRGARAREVLAAQLEITPEGVDRFELLERLGLALLGAGDRRGAHAGLGAAFTRGSSNAGVVLGRLALAGGQRKRARALFRTLLDEERGRSWALRGWGLSMLPLTPGRL